MKTRFSYRVFFSLSFLVSSKYRYCTVRNTNCARKYEVREVVFYDFIAIMFATIGVLRVLKTKRKILHFHQKCSHGIGQFSKTLFVFFSINPSPQTVKQEIRLLFRIFDHCLLMHLVSEHDFAFVS